MFRTQDDYRAGLWIRCGRVNKRQSGDKTGLAKVGIMKGLPENCVHPSSMQPSVSKIKRKAVETNPLKPGLPIRGRPGRSLILLRRNAM